MRRITHLIVLSVSLASPSLAQQDWTLEQQAVHAAIESYLAAWNSGDANALAAQCAADCDRIDARGNVYSGQEAIRRHYADLFARPAPPGYPRKLTYDVRSIRLLSPTLAIVDADYTLENPPPCPGGTIEGMNTVVLTKVDNRWLRRAHRQRIPNQLAISRDCQRVIEEDAARQGGGGEFAASVEAVIDAQNRMYAAMLSGDVDRFIEHLSAEFVATDPANNVWRRAELAEILKSGQLRYEDIEDEIDFADVLSDGLAVVAGTETTQQSAVPVEGSLEERALSSALVRRYTHVYRQEGDSWRLLVKQSTIISERANR